MVTEPQDVASREELIALNQAQAVQIAALIARVAGKIVICRQIICRKEEARLPLPCIFSSELICICYL